MSYSQNKGEEDKENSIRHDRPCPVFLVCFAVVFCLLTLKIDCNKLVRLSFLIHLFKQKNVSSDIYIISQHHPVYNSVLTLILSGDI